MPAKGGGLCNRPALHGNRPLFGWHGFCRRGRPRHCHLGRRAGGGDVYTGLALCGDRALCGRQRLWGWDRRRGYDLGAWARAGRLFSGSGQEGARTLHPRQGRDARSRHGRRLLGGTAKIGSLSACGLTLNGDWALLARGLDRRRGGLCGFVQAGGLFGREARALSRGPRCGSGS